jgi:hypothetical protein
VDAVKKEEVEVVEATEEGGVKRDVDPRRLRQTKEGSRAIVLNLQDLCSTVRTTGKQTNMSLT